MKNAIWRMGLPVLGLAALLIAPAANAQYGTMRVDIPFDFIVGSKVLSAGQYYATVEAKSNVLHLQSGSQSFNVMTAAPIFPVELSKGRSRLVFHQYGKVYILREVWTNAGNSGYELFPTKAERELARASSPATVPVLSTR